MMLLAIGSLLILAFALYQLNCDLKWEVKHLRSELDSAKKFERQLLDQLDEVNEMVVGKVRKRRKLGDNEWPDEIG